MAVYTPLSFSDVESLLASYELSNLVSVEEIGAGIENSNFFVTTADASGTQSKWVLTLFETLTEQQLPYFLDVLVWLNVQHLPVAAPKANLEGSYLQRVKGKPAILVPCLEGRSRMSPSLQECAAIGKVLARMHLVSAQVPVKRTPVRDLDWLEQAQVKLALVLPESDKLQLQQEITHYASSAAGIAVCPQGLVHGDLFRDNVLFTGEEVTGLIDFYHACDDALLFDLAVVINDWATDGQGHYHSQKVQAIIDGYQSVRVWSVAEQQAWRDILRLAALRFWVSRLLSRHLSGYQKQSTQGDTTKNPEEFRSLLTTLAA
ncbi:MAG: homoserine kinase [Hahellaceae bacterium]|nr:homoserine kinase [Hahellaceae bacterium]MCP5168430.1 homoserine kinase [Hahellaceae bacterium]